MDITIKQKQEKPKKDGAVDYTKLVWGKPENQGEQPITEKINNRPTTIGKYWVCSNIVYFGINPNKNKMFNTVKEAQDAISKLYNMGVAGVYIIVQDNATKKYYIKSC